MGNRQSDTKKIKTEIMNNTDIQMKFKKVNDTINETTVEIINKVSDEMKVDSKTQLEQKLKGISIKDIKDSKGVSITIEQELDQMETINITSIQNIKQDSKIVQDLQKKLSTDMQKAMASQQESSSSEGEQAMKELMGALTGAVSAAMQALNPGGQKTSDTDVETMIKNELNIASDTAIENKTKNIMNNKMITDTLSKLSTSFDVYLSQIIDGDISIEGVTSSSDIGIALKQSGKITRDVALKKMNDTGMGSKILAQMLEVDETEVKETLESAQKTAEKQEGTLEAAGGAVKDVGEGISTAAQGVGKGVSTGFGGIMQAMIGPMVIVGVVAIVGLFVIKPMLEKMESKDIANIISSSQAKKSASAPVKVAKPIKMKGGSMKKFKSFYNKIIDLFSKLVKIVKPYLTLRNLNIVLALLVGYQIIKFFINLFKKEGFNDDEINKNYYIKIDNKYIKRNDGNIELVDDKKDASLISVVKIIDNVFLKFGEDFAITSMGGKLKVMKNVPLFYPRQKVSYNKKDNSLQINEKYISLNGEGIIDLSDNKSKITLEQ